MQYAIHSIHVMGYPLFPQFGMLSNPIAMSLNFGLSIQFTLVASIIPCREMYLCFLKIQEESNLHFKKQELLTEIRYMRGNKDERNN